MSALTERSIVDRARQPPHEPLRLELDKLAQLEIRPLLVRFALGFTISVAAGIIVEAAGPVFGGMFLAFPAILPAAVTLLERQLGLAQASADVRGATAGALGMIAFAWVAWTLLRRAAPALALGAALISWVAVSAAAYLVMHVLVHALGEHHYLPEIPTVEAAEVLEAIKERGWTMATAESCTGGLLAAHLTSVPGADEVFRGSIVAYDASVKARRLGIGRSLLDHDGAVSPAVAAGMAEQVRSAIGADVGLATTGNTGAPNEGKPAGLTFLAVSLPNGATWVRRYADDLGPGRNDERAVRMAFRLLRDALADRSDPEHDVNRTGSNAQRSPSPAPRRVTSNGDDPASDDGAAVLRNGG
jgi:nicotinamide-nucleotide amidase